MLRCIRSLVFLAILPQIATADIAVSFLDVGQGDATLLQTSSDCTILIDTGRHDRNDVVAHLSAAGVQHIDYLIGTHPHADHIGQFPQVLSRFPVGEVWMSGWEHGSRTFERALDAILETNAGYEEPRAGHVTECGDAQMRVLHPVDPLTDIHDNLVVRVDYGAFSLIVTGDAEIEHEHQMVRRGEPLQATVLQLGHHGSYTSSAPEFLRAVSPQLAVYSAGVGNSYGHPHDAVRQRVRDFGIALIGTDQYGTIRVTSDGQHHVLETKRDGEAPSLAAPPEKFDGALHHADTAAPTCIDVNAAPAQELERIIHIGDTRAAEIIRMRDREQFGAVKDLVRMPGIGPGRLKDITTEGLACAE